jgi:hypothetical protein
LTWSNAPTPELSINSNCKQSTATLPAERAIADLAVSLNSAASELVKVLAMTVRTSMPSLSNLDSTIMVFAEFVSFTRSAAAREKYLAKNALQAFQRQAHSSQITK